MKLFLRGLVLLIVAGMSIPVGLIATKITDPLLNSMIQPATLSSLGWGEPATTIVFFMHIVIVGIPMVTAAWMITAPLQEDIRQEVY